MKHLTFLVVCAFFADSLAENCDKLGILLYEDLACQPVLNDGSCPQSFNCNNLQVPNKCVVQGKTYDAGQSIQDNSIGFSCEFGCFCSTTANKSSIVCAQGSCREWGELLPPNGCYRKYNLDQCCSSGLICPPFEDTTKCVVDGIEHKAGERFVPKDSCHVCVCQKGFSGKLEAPYCKRSGCDAQIKNQAEVQNSCAPVYIKEDSESDKKCCPRFWTCPDGSEVIKNGSEKSDLTCQFGERKLRLGDGFEKEVQYSYRPLKIKCECRIPPLLTCYGN